MDEEIKKIVPSITSDELVKLVEFIQSLRVKSETLGKINGINQIRIAFWGIGYDNDETARRVRKLTTSEITKLREPFDIEKSLNERWID